jgi:hypothetical protein
MSKTRSTASPPLHPDSIERRIHVIRGDRVMLDEDLAAVYRTTTKRLNQQVNRNLDRFPDDFAFLLTWQEVENLKSQIVTSSWGGRRKLPRVFTERGAVMLAGVLSTPVAVLASVQVVRAFVRMRGLLLTQRELARKLAEIEKSVPRHDHEIQAVFEAIRQLLENPSAQRGRIGFTNE